MDTRVLAELRRLARTDDERARLHNFRAFDPASAPDAPGKPSSSRRYHSLALRRAPKAISGGSQLAKTDRLSAWK